MKLNETQEQWDALGRDDAMWAVLTDPRRKGAWTREEFLATGRDEIAETLALLDHLGIRVPRTAALDFGCGAGRLTLALSEHFERAVGVDIAPSMLTQARHNAEGRPCEFVLEADGSLGSLPDAAFGLVYTARVLQHMAPEHADRYLGEFLRVLAPDGVLVFQRPSTPARTVAGLGMRLAPTRITNALRRVVTRSAGTMEMHGASEAHVRRVIEAAGGRVVHSERDTKAGPHWISYTYVVRKGDVGPARSSG
jgi:ubiquinone/menaquinone biosynthesis C-methylase UbiE